MGLSELFAAYDRLVVFDTETTGLSAQYDEIIEFAAAVLECRNGRPVVTEEYDNLIRLPAGARIPQQIVELTGITDGALQERGIEREQLCADIARLFAGRTLVLAYNAQFDLCFVFYTLMRNGNAELLRGLDKLDLLTVYKDRRPYPHKLAAAIEAYNLGDKVQNSHRAIDDVLATVAVMEAMDAEKPDLERYINLFGYNPKHGISYKPIRSVTYKPQGYHNQRPLYEM